MDTICFHQLTSSPGDKFHLTRATIPGGSTIRQHTHDFIEILWVDGGEATHEVNGESVSIRTNHLIMMRTGDVHGFTCDRESNLVLVNIAFRAEILEHIRSRYFPGAPFFYGGESRLPKMVDLDNDFRRRAGDHVDLLANEPRTLFHIERFLLNLFHHIESRSAEEFSPLCPDWLMRAYTLVQKPEIFTGGVKAFRRLCGKSATHVARESREWLKSTPSQIINRTRMDYAAKELSMTDRTILDISLDCGFSSLSRFYQIFKQQYRMSPRKYRIKNKSVTGRRGLET
ncbi:MAG: AraC family transcriptional regulator [Proteobacteria bacterium]|nr:AraC family transcriptional regulator [Pseudomonadota bacterium]